MKTETATKLKISPSHSILVLNDQKSLALKLKNADDSAKKNKVYDCVLVVVTSKADVDQFASKALKAISSEGLLWFLYPKKTSGIKTDLSRDYGWQNLQSSKYEAVSLVSVNETWSALRFKSVDKIKVMKRAKPKSDRQRFIGKLETQPGGIDATYISIPFNVEEVFGTRGQVKVKVLFDGYPYRGVIANMGTCGHIIGVRKDIRQAIGKKVGDSIKVELEQDIEERIVDVPEDLKEAFANSPKAAEFFNSLSFTNRKEYAVWISSAKKDETRKRRLNETLKKLLAKKKNPTEK